MVRSCFVSCGDFVCYFTSIQRQKLSFFCFNKLIFFFFKNPIKAKAKIPNFFFFFYSSLKDLFFCFLWKFGAMGMAAAESQFHVLAVDDSVIDRKLIERLLKNSACQGTFLMFRARILSLRVRNFIKCSLLGF